MRQASKRVPDRPPAPGRDNEIAEDRGHGETRHYDEGHESEPAPARLRGHKLRHGRIADHDLSAESEALDETADDELCHVLRKGRGKRGKPEHQQVDLICEATAHLVTNKSGYERAERHANECEREELQ